MYGQYPKEYDEALSRLEASERSPLPYAPLPYGPVPNHCNYMNWNRIMAETRQGVLPKYSILQRIDLGSQNDLVNVSDAKEYTYTLDPSFTFAKGARKSIAVRAVDIYNVIPNGQTVSAHEQFKCGFRIRYLNGAAPGQVEFLLSDIDYECSNDLPVSMNNFARALNRMIYAECYAKDTKVLQSGFSCYYNAEDNEILIQLLSSPSRTITFMAIEGYDDTVWNEEPAWRVSASSIADYYNLNSTGRLDPIDFTYELLADENMIQIHLPLPRNMIDVRRSSVCGNINPWTKNNLIAPLTYTSDTLTKVFPWNGSTEARFWFINDKGEKVRWRVVRGYIDLELIIDNSDTYAIDNN